MKGKILAYWSFANEVKGLWVCDVHLTAQDGGQKLLGEDGALTAIKVIILGCQRISFTFRGRPRISLRSSIHSTCKKRMNAVVGRWVGELFIACRLRQADVRVTCRLIMSNSTNTFRNWTRVSEMHSGTPSCDTQHSSCHGCVIKKKNVLERARTTPVLRD